MGNKLPVVGIGIMVVKGGTVLVGKRLVGHGADTFAFPGGHLEFGESFEDCIRRELDEEVGIKVRNIRFVRPINDRSRKKSHYVELAFVADWQSGEPQNKEPDKCAGWSWYYIDQMPQPLFRSMPDYVSAYLNSGCDAVELEP